MWADGVSREVPALWLYDHGEPARDPTSGQRAHGARDLDATPLVEAARIEGETLVLRFEPGQIERRIDGVRLRPTETPAARSTQALWVTAAPIEAAGPIPFAAYLQEDSALAEALGRVVRDGLVWLTGAGETPGAVERAVARFGHVRETNYGRTFDVRVEANPNNLAYTARGLDLHTDNPYREPPPSLQILHALRADPSGGGATAFVDGFAHAAALRGTAPDHFHILAGETVGFAYADAKGRRWQASSPVIEVAPDGSLRGVRINHRSLVAPLLPARRMEAWYAAYLDLYRRVHGPEAAWERVLAPGDLVIFDNRRILHGRRAFSNGGARWLQGCYADRDGLDSTLAGLVDPGARP